MTREQDETQLTGGPPSANNPPAEHSLAGHASDAALLVIALLSFTGFVILTIAVSRSVVFPFDQPLLALARGWDGVPAIWNTTSQSANIPLIVIGVGFVLWLLLTNRRREAVLVALMLIAVTAGSEGVKQLVARPRPSGTGDGIPGVVYSYPSGHVLEVLTILGSITLRSWRSSRSLRLRLALVILVTIEVVLVAIARLALNEHYPTDVLGGFLGAIGALALYGWLTRPGGWARQTGADSDHGRAARRESQVAVQPDSVRVGSHPDDTVGTQAGPLSEAGPLGPVAAARPATPGTLPDPPSGLATATVVVGFGALIASLVVLGSVAQGVRAQEVFALDTWATPFLHGIASPGMDTLMNGATDLGTSLVIVPIFVIVVAWLIRQRRFGLALYLGIALGGSFVLQGAMKLFFARPRPQLPWATVLPDYSFPSGHTMNAVIFYSALALILWSVFGRRIGLVALAIAAVLAFGVGVSRIYLGYHYLTDVVGGILAGIAWLLVVGAAFRAQPTWRRWRSLRTPRPGGPDHPGAAAVERVKR